MEPASNPTVYFVFLRYIRRSYDCYDILVQEVPNQRIPVQIDFAFPSWAIGNQRLGDGRLEWISAGDERIALRLCLYDNQWQEFMPADHPFVWRPLVEFVMKLGASDVQDRVARTHALADRYLFPYLEAYRPTVLRAVRSALHHCKTVFACIRPYRNAQGEPSLAILMESVRLDGGSAEYRLPIARAPKVPTYPFECFPTIRIRCVYSWNALRVYKPGEHATALQGELGDLFEGRTFHWVDLFSFIDESSQASSVNFEEGACSYMLETLLPYLEAHHPQLLYHADVEHYVWRDALYPEIWAISRDPNRMEL